MYLTQTVACCDAINNSMVLCSQSCSFKKKKLIKNTSIYTWTLPEDIITVSDLTGISSHLLIITNTPHLQ